MMNRPLRKFEVEQAARAQVPLLIGLTGPSSSGKTKSALRLADGMLKVFGGEHYLIDTESRRALHYADAHTFKHVEFGAPYGSLDYLDAIRQCVKAGASVITIDSMSHEHESEGGMLDMQEQELTRMAGNDYHKREQCKFAAWIKPKRHRTMLLQGILTLNCNFIFCFRAREKVKPIKRDGKTEFINVGYQAIAGEEFLFEQTVNVLLRPGAKGVPTWESAEIGEQQLIKLPAYLEHCFHKREALNEKTGECLAQWAAGVGRAPAANKLGEPAGASGVPEKPSAPGKPRPTEPPPTHQEIEEADAALSLAANRGMAELERLWFTLSIPLRKQFKPDMDGLKALAAKVDAAMNAPIEGESS